MRRGLFSVLMLACGLTVAAVAEPAMFLSPLRVELGPNENIAVITVTNKSEKNKYYQAVLSDQAMVSDTTTLEVATFPYSAKKMLRFMPRRFDLQPGQRQVIRVMVRRPEGLADGDYHTHLLFEEDLAARTAAAVISNTALPEGLVKFQIEATYSVAIPVIVQHGVVASSIALGPIVYSPTAAQGKPALIANFIRSGNAEAGGFLTATINGMPVIEKRRLRLYREVDNYQIVLPLDTSKLAAGQAIIVKLADSFADNAKVIGQTRVQLP